MRNTKIISFVLLQIFMFSAAFSKPFVNTHSMTGTAKLQRAGTVEWKILTKDTKLFNNDIVRVSDSGLVILHWPNGTIAYVHKKTKILITLFQKKK